MSPSLKCSFTTVFVCSCLFFSSWENQTFAQKNELNRGFSISPDLVATGEELASQKSLWVLDAVFKPMRMVRMDLTDPQTGKKEKTLVWYLAHRDWWQRVLSGAYRLQRLGGAPAG